MSAPRPTLDRPPDPSPARLQSLDVFRGATIAGMTLVNNPGDWGNVYPQLLHANWHGWTFTDLIYPFFLWIVGVSLTLSFARRVERGDHRGRLFLHTFRRAATIFAIGLLINFLGSFNLATVRIPGVLQRIAICYLVAAVIFLRTSWKAQAIWAAALLAVYWALMTLVPVPGHGPGVLEPGRNLANWIDSIVLRGHMWRETLTWDPEGLLSTLPAIATTLMGVLTGHVLRLKRSAAEKTAWLFAAGNALMFAAVVMSIWFPINKSLWTSSFAVLMAGLAANVFAFCYWVVDVQGWRRWAYPFKVFGVNAIAIYVLTDFIVIGAEHIHIGGQPLQRWLFQNLYAPFAAPKMASLLWAVSFVALMYLIAWVLYRRNWFIKV
ncbi:MAG TPA: heparan-alpha-glucosaminide N-acetyltransferase domain-containing protein [Bryobacteraceae bacterium]|nr:heparan-alpha-glucosaminide N-acetyltransferase domain-containing protein [Bryobacteraceae bacterium]